MNSSLTLNRSAGALKFAIGFSFCAFFTIPSAFAGDKSIYFNRVTSVPTTINLTAVAGSKKPDWETHTSAEIITASDDGNTLIYSDSLLQGVGFISIEDIESPQSAGFYKTKGKPTSVISDKGVVLVGVDTSEEPLEPSGHLLALSMVSKQRIRSCEIGGQPASLAMSKDNKYLAVAVENKQDESFVNNDLYTGHLIVFPLKGGFPLCGAEKKVSLTGLSEIASNNPEPRFLDFNENNDIVVSLKRNNHIVVVSAETGEVTQHFSAGSVDSRNIDSNNRRQLKRNPEAIRWLDDDRFVTVNKSDSSSFTIFNKKGDVLFESGLNFENEVILAGHYPQEVFGNQGVAPDGLEVATFNGERYIFVISGRCSVVGVYKDTGDAPELLQLLPSGVGPESGISIPHRNLFVTANEKDMIESKGPRSHIMLFEFGKGDQDYPQIESVMKDDKPINWGALSGMVADPDVPGRLYAVSDSVYHDQPTIFTIDANQSPAKIIDATIITRGDFPAQKLDLEGITVDGEGGFWLASEGKTKHLRPHALYHVNAQGKIGEKKDSEVIFPRELLKYQEHYGSEGVTRIGDVLWIAIQRRWRDDPKNTTKLVAYNIKTKEWGAVLYPTEKTVKGSKSWFGLSEITAYGDYVYIVERDNHVGKKAKFKRLYRVNQSELTPVALGEDLPIVKKELVRDLLPDLQKLNGYAASKVEGFAIDSTGKSYVVTDNDGNSGETYFFSIGEIN